MKQDIVRTAAATLPTVFGRFTITIYRTSSDKREHVVLFVGKMRRKPVLVRIHSQCLTGDTFLSLRCDCREQLHKSMEIIQKKKSGIILYLNQEGRGIGLTEKMKAYALQEKGLDTVEANEALGYPADERDYAIAAEILKDLGVTHVSLLTNNPSKKDGLTKHGIHIAKTVPLEVAPNAINKAYLKSKKQKLGHVLRLV